MAVPNNTPSQAQQSSGPSHQTIYWYNYYYPYYSYYYPYSYGFPAYPPPKYYYEITRYAPPFAPPGKKQNPKMINFLYVFLAVIAILNIVTGGVLLFAAYDENHVHTVILTGYITDANTTSPLENVEITVSDQDLTVYSDANGTFEIPLATGVHSLVFEKEGYQKINSTVVVGKYLDNQMSVEMERGNGTRNQNLTSFQTIDDYIANLMVSSTLSVFVGCFALISALYIRKVKYRSMGIVAGVLGIFSLFILSGIALIFMIPAVLSAILGFAVVLMIYFSSDLFIFHSITTTGTN